MYLRNCGALILRENLDESLGAATQTLIPAGSEPFLGNCIVFILGWVVAHVHTMFQLGEGHQEEPKRITWAAH